MAQAQSQSGFNRIWARYRGYPQDIAGFGGFAQIFPPDCPLDHPHGSASHPTQNIDESRPMPITVTRTDPRDPQATALLHASHALMQELFNPEENHFLSIDQLCTPDITFLAASDGTQLLGTGALANRGDYGEVKSMFTAPQARGKGVADAILSALIETARAQSLPWLRLETGDSLHAAHRLYARHGFTTCTAFGDYVTMPTSVFMEKRL